MAITPVSTLTKTQLLAEFPSQLLRSQGMASLRNQHGPVEYAAIQDLIATVFEISPHRPVQCATTGALAAYTRVGAVITADVNGALGAIDGITLVAGERLLLKDGAAGADNGIYEITDVGDGANAYELTRIAELTTGADAAGAFCHVEQGTANGNHWAVCTDDSGSAVVDTDALTFSMVNLAGLTAAAPAAVAAAAVVGTGTLAARDDHVHAHGALANGGALYHDSDQIEDMSDISAADLTAAIDQLNDNGTHILKVTLTTADLTTVGVNQEVAIPGFPANSMPVAAWIELDTDFSGGGASAVTASIGDTGDTVELTGALNVFTGAGAGLKAGGGTYAPYTFEAAYVPVCSVTSDVNVSALTAGSMVVNIMYFTPVLDTP